MRLFFVVDETNFYHPEFLADFINATKDEVVGAAVVTKIPKSNSIEYYLIKHWYYLKLFEWTKLVIQKVFAILLDFKPCSTNGKYYSVRSVFKCNQIDYFEIKDNINQENYLNRIREKNIDVLISSNSLIFGQELLDMPSKCCINRHSALLPSYGGLWPVFQAYRNGEKFTGVSIHTMEKEIDKGVVLSAKAITIEHDSSIADLYKECFKQSSVVLLEALEKVRNGDFQECETNSDESYYSFPTKEHWLEFRERNGRFI